MKKLFLILGLALAMNSFAQVDHNWATTVKTVDKYHFDVINTQNCKNSTKTPYKITVSNDSTSETFISDSLQTGDTLHFTLKIPSKVVVVTLHNCHPDGSYPICEVETNTSLYVLALDKITLKGNESGLFYKYEGSRTIKEIRVLRNGKLIRTIKTNASTEKINL